MNGIIIGAGIGGLSTAIAMQMRQIPVRIFEATVNLSPIGAGILVPPNAMTILEWFGLANQILDSGNAIESLVVVDTHGRTISKTPAFYAKNGLIHQTVAIHRGRLQAILLGALASDTVLTGKQCLQVRTDGEGAEAEFRDGSTVRGDFLVGADGIHSKVRESIFPNSPLRYSGQTCWRGVSSAMLPAKWASQLTEVWGFGLRLGFVPIGTGQVYWYATKPARAGGMDDPEDIKGQLLNLYGEFPGPSAEIISGTESSAIIRDDISDLAPLNSWFSGAVMLMGDAAHASTPNLGQGGAQAIEDSWVLAEKLVTCKTLHEAYGSFQVSRRARVNRIVQVSWQIGKVTSLSNKMACRMRNTIFRCIPPSIANSQSRAIYDVSY